MHRIPLLAAACCLHVSICAQPPALGWDAFPAPSTAIAPPADHGTYPDLSGGVAVGDEVPDFTVYGTDGTSVNLYALLGGDRPVVVINGSVTCNKFADVFRTDVEHLPAVNSRNFLLEHADDFAFLFLYNMEAHPTSGPCPTNCPPGITTDTLVAQHATYGDRLAALATWEAGEDLAFPFAMYADNPDNGVYNALFERPSGMVAIGCDGRVALRADWLSGYLADAAGTDELLEWAEAFAPCALDAGEQGEPAGASVAPNPVGADRTAAVLTLDEPGALVELLDLAGRIRWSVWAASSSTDLPVEALAPGVYFIHVRWPGARRTLRLVVA